MESIEMSLDMPKTPNSTQKKKRNGWWDVNTKQEDMDRIKQMIQNRKVLSRPGSEERKLDLRRVELEPIKRELKEPENALENTIEKVTQTKIEQVSSPKVTPLVKTRDVKTEQETIRMEKKSLVELPVAPAAEKTRRKKPMWIDIGQEPGEESKEVPNPPLQKRTFEPTTPPRPNTTQSIPKIKQILNESVSNAKIEPIEVYKHLLEKNMDQTAELYQKEAKIPMELTRSLKLYHYVQKRDFGRAVVLVQTVLQSIQDSSSIPSFEDLIYVLSKYLLIHLQQAGQIPIAERTLKFVIWPMVQKEQQRGGIRSEWFTKDYFLLNNLIGDSVYADNVYKNLDWGKELEKFWSSLDYMNSNEPPPLFAYALNKYFQPTLCGKLEEYQASHQKLQMISKLIKEDSSVPFVRLHRPIRKQTPEQVNQQSLSEFTKIQEPVPPFATEPQDTPKRQDRPPISEISSSTNQSRLHQRNLDELPPMSHEPHSSNFALSKACGPLPSIRVMDVQTIPETGQVIAITAGNEKELAVWDVKENCILATLENCTVKPIVIVQFHPSFPELVLSADMENDVKLWNWKEGSLVRWWKKHHSRIIYQIGFVPGDEVRAVSCSGDQSLKIWSIHADKTTNRASVHANEPITSFAFCGSPSDPLQQKLIISMSYSIRIYKLRTLGLIHTIHLPDLKLTKTPVFFMESHPLFDNFILLSADNQLKLIDINTEKVVKSFTARFNTTQRLKGKFSPCGTFVYANSCELRIGAHTNLDQDEEQFMTGSLIWRVHTGKLEKREMAAMEETQLEHTGDQVKPTGVLCSKWLTMIDKSKKGVVKKYKIMVTAGRDKLLRVYI